MALNVGTVEAVLSARDQFSDKFIIAAENVLKLRDALKNVGDASPAEIQKVQAALVSAEAEFIRVRDSAQAFRAEADQLNFTSGAAARAILQIVEASRQAQAATEASVAQDQVKAQSTDAVTSAINEQTAAIKTNAAAQASGFTPVAGSPLPPVNPANVAPDMTGFEAAYSSQQARAAELGLLAGATTKVKDATKEAEEEEVRYSQSLTQVEGIATRLVERMLILYAIRGTLQFVEGVFEAAEQMLTFSERLGVSIDLLETLKYAGAQTGVPFTALTTSVDGLNKSLEQVKPAANDALHQLGLNLEEIFQLSPDERFNRIITALSGVTDQAQRQALEIKLGLGDAIDTVVQKWQLLQEQSDSSMTKMGDETTRILGEQARLFKSLALEIEGYAAHLIDWGQRIVAFAATPFFYSGDPAQDARTSRTRQIQAGDMMVDVAQIPGSTQHDTTLGPHIGSSTPAIPASQFIGPPTPQGPEMGDMYIASLKRQQQALQELTPHQIEQLTYLKSINDLNEQTAARIGVTTDQYRMFEAQLRSTTSAQTAAMRDAGDWDSVVAKWGQAEQAQEAIGDRGLRATIDRLDKQQAAEEAAAQKKLDTSKDTDKWEQYNQTVEAIDEKYAAQRADAEQKANDGRQRQQEQNAERLESIEQQTQDIELEIGLRGINLKLAQLQVQEDRQKAAENRRIEAQRQSSASSIQDEIQYVATMLAIDEQFEAKRQQILIAAVQNIENNAKPIEGPIKDMPLFKTDIDFAVLHDGTTQWGKDLSEVTRALRDLATVSDGTFKGVVQDLSRVLAAANVTNVALGQYEEGRWGMGTPVDTTMGLAGAGIGFMGATGSGNMASDMVGGAVSGGEIGLEFGGKLGPWGAAIGAGAGLLIGFLRDAFGTDYASDEATRMGTQFGQSWSEGLQKKVTDRAKSLNDELAGEIASLPDIIKEQPIDTHNLDIYEGKVHDIFSEIEMGHIKTADAAKELDQVFPQLAAVATDSYGRVSDKLKEIIALNQQFGTDSKAIADWQKGQVASIVSGWSAEVLAFTSDSSTATEKLRSEIEDLQAKISDLQNKKTPLTAVQKENLADYQDQLQQDQVKLSFAQTPPSPDELQAVGAGAVGTVAMQMATGTSRSDAVKAESQALTQLESEYKKLGIDITDVGLKSLFMQNDVQKAAPQLIAGVEGLRKEIVGLDNLHLETGEKFKSNESLGVAMYTKIQGAVAALGGSTADALTEMQDYLHVAKDEADKLHEPLDANLQLMIDQSKELGVWDENASKAKDPTEKLADAIQRLVDWLDKIPSNKTTDVTVNTHNNSDINNTDNSGGRPAPAPRPNDPPAESTGGIPARIAAAGPLVPPLMREMGGDILPLATGLAGGGDSGALPEYVAGGEHMVKSYCVPAHMSRNPSHHETGGEVEPVYADQGAYISWVPRGSDVVPAMLTPGEGIISVPGMEGIGGASSLSMINAGDAKVVAKSQTDSGQPITVTVDPPILQPAFNVTLDPSKAAGSFDMRPQGLGFTPADAAPLSSLSAFAANAPRLTDPTTKLSEFAGESYKLIDPVGFLNKFAGSSSQMTEPIRHLDSFASASPQMAGPVSGLSTFATNSPILMPPVQALEGFTVASPQMTEPVSNLRTFASQSPAMTAPVSHLVDFTHEAPALTVPATMMTGFAHVAPSITAPAQQMTGFASVAGQITAPATTLTEFADKADLVTQPVQGMISFSDAAPQTTEPVGRWTQFATASPQMMGPLDTLISFVAKVIDLAGHLPVVGTPPAQPTPPPFSGGLTGPITSPGLPNPTPIPIPIPGGPYHGGINSLAQPAQVAARAPSVSSPPATSSSVVVQDTTHVTINATDARSFQDLLERDGVGVITKVIRNNMGYARTEWRQALGIK